MRLPAWLELVGDPKGTLAEDGRSVRFDVRVNREVLAAALQRLSISDMDAWSRRYVEGDDDVMREFAAAIADEIEDHVHDWQRCETCDDGSMVCPNHPVPFPHQDYPVYRR